MNRLLAFALLLGLALGSFAQAGTILVVSDNGLKSPRSGTSEDDFAAFLSNLGHTVYVSDPQQYREANEGAAGAAAFVADNAVDLVIVSRDTDSGQYKNATGWNTISKPLLLMSPYLSRRSRWKWLDTTSAKNDQIDDMKIVAPSDPFVAGLTGSYTSGGYVSYNGTTDPGNGTLIGTTPDDMMWLVKWDAGTEFYAGSGQTAGALRVLLGGIPYHETHDDIDMTFDHYSENGKAIIAQVVNTMIPEPATIALLGLGGLAVFRRKR